MKHTTVKVHPIVLGLYKINSTFMQTKFLVCQGNDPLLAICPSLSMIQGEEDTSEEGEEEEGGKEEGEKAGKDEL